MATLVTNGLYLVLPEGTIEDLKELVEEVIKPNLKAYLGSSANLKFVNNPFPCYKLPENVTYDVLSQAAGSDHKIKYRSINDDKFLAPGTSLREYTHTFSDVEKAEISEELCLEIEKREKLEAAKKAETSRLNGEISKHDNVISELAKKHRDGKEVREKQVEVEFHFNEGMKYFIDPETKEMLDSDELSDDDYQLKIDYRAVV